MTDNELLQQYVESNAHDAFAQLARRHANWVNSMAARLTHDRALADDVTQAVFLLLARKAKSLRRESTLSTWLFGVTRFASSTAMRKEIRRRTHERKAAAMREDSVSETTHAEWQQLAPALDELVSRLRSADRQAVLLRFYEQKSFVEIGDELHISEEAARKRVSRSIERLRKLFAGKGVAVGTAALTATLSVNMSESASAAVIASAAAQGGTTAALTPLAQGTGTAMFWTSLKPIAAILGSILFAGAAAVTLLQIAPTRPPVAASPTTAPASVVISGPRYVGRVLGLDSAPIVGAKIYLINSDGISPRVIATVESHAPEGSFVLPRLPDSSAILVSAPGAGMTAINLIPDMAGIPIDIKMRKASNILARFVDPQDKPAAGVRISVSQIADSRQRWQVRIPEELQNKLVQTTDAEGVCTIEAMPENSVVSLDVLDPRYIRPQAPPQPNALLGAADGDPAIWVGPSGLADGGVIKLEAAGAISGSVTYADTGKPAAGVAVRVQPQIGSGPLPTRGGRGGIGLSGAYVTTIAVTDINGRYVRPQLRAGNYTVLLDGGGEIGAKYNAPAIGSVVVKADKETTSQDFKLTAGGTIRGKVVANGRPVSGIQLIVVGPSAPTESRAGQSMRTSDDGTYVFHVAPGTQTVALMFPLPDGYTLPPYANPTITVDADQTVSMNDIVLGVEPGALTTGRVIDADGKPVVGARISAQAAPGTGIRGRGGISTFGRSGRGQAITVSNTAGNFSAYNVGAGIQLRAQKGDQVSSPVPIPQDNSPITLKLGESSFSTISVQVRDSEGAPVHDAKVMLNIGIGASRGAQGQTGFLSTGTGEGMVTGANGNCLFEEMDPAAQYMVNVSAKGFGGRTLSVQLQPGQRSDLSVVLPRMDTFIGGIVLDENFKPAVGIDLYVGPGVGPNLESNKKIKTDANGRFRIEGYTEDALETATIRHADGFAERRHLLRSGSNDNLLVDRPAASVVRGVRPATRQSVPTDPAYMPEEEAAANALIALGATVSTDFSWRNVPVITVRLTRAGATDEQLKPLAQLKSLEMLTISNSNITDAGMAAIYELRGLTSLSLLNSKITDAGVKPLTQLKFLQTLSLSGTTITDAALADIAQLPTLTSLTVANTKITDAGLKQLSQLKYLATLNLTGTAISDQGLKDLKAFRSLRSVTLRGTAVTDEGVRELQEALPALRIVR